MRYAGAQLIQGAQVGVGLQLQAEALSKVPLGPGLESKFADQLALHWAVRREFALRAGAASAAVYDKGRFVKRIVIPNGDVIPDDATPIFGDGPTEQLWPAHETDPTPQWGRTCALALDAALAELGRQKVGPEVPPLRGEGGLTPAALPAIVLVGIIVAGAAVTVISSTAVWRYLDPEFRVAAAAIDAGTAAYDLRVRAFVASNVMPPVSPIETGAAEVIKDYASKAETNGLLMAGAVAGGVAALTIIAGALGSKGAAA